MYIIQYLPTLQYQLYRWISYAQVQGSQMHIYDYFVCTIKKMGDSCAFDIQCYKFPLYYIIVWNEELLGLKKQHVNNGKFT